MAKSYDMGFKTKLRICGVPQCKFPIITYRTNGRPFDYDYDTGNKHVCHNRDDADIVTLGKAKKFLETGYKQSMDEQPTLLSGG